MYKCDDCQTWHNGGHICMAMPRITVRPNCITCGEAMQDGQHVCPTDPAAFEGKKHDEGKPDLSLLRRECLDATAQAFMYGEQKYGRDNYLNGMDWHRLIAAALRHITAFNAGEDKDAESGLSHLAHAAACINMLITYQTYSLGKDTRCKK